MDENERERQEQQVRKAKREPLSLAPATATLAQQVQSPRQSTGKTLAPKAGAQPLRAVRLSRLHKA